MGIVLEQTEPPAPVLDTLPFPAPPLQPSPEGVGGGERGDTEMPPFPSSGPKSAPLPVAAPSLLP